MTKERLTYGSLFAKYKKTLRENKKLKKSNAELKKGLDELVARDIVTRSELKSLVNTVDASIKELSKIND